MEYIDIGKIVNTHALNGEVRIISNFEFKEKIFVNKFDLYIGKEKNKETILSYRKHKIYDMVKFYGIDSIDDALKYKGKSVYIIKSDLILKENEILISELIGMNAYYKNMPIGTIDDVLENGKNTLIKINSTLIPYHNNFIESINKESNRIDFKNLEGLYGN